MSTPEKGAAAPQPVNLLQRIGTLNRWREQYNPLRGLTIARAVSLLEAGQRGEFADLQWAYFFIEQTDALPFALIERRIGALLEMDWNIKVVAPSNRISGIKSEVAFDDALAREQAEFLREAYDRIDNLYEAIEHLALASFRSFAHLQFHRNTAGDVEHLEPLDQWNFVRNGMYGGWKWNPAAQSTGYSSIPGEPINEDEFLIRVVRRHIDRIALIKVIRKSLGEKDWSGFVEIYGIPATFVIGPPGVSPEKEDEYEEAAEEAAAGGSGYFPHGSDVKFNEGPRGVNPFHDYIRYLDEQLVLTATGGLLTMLPVSGSGTLAGSAHMEAFKTVAGGEAQRISELFQKQFDKRLLAKQFPGKPVLAYWELAARQEKNPGAILDDAVKAKNAGLMIDPDELSEKTGYKIIVAPAAAPMLVSPGAAGATLLNQAPKSAPVGPDHPAIGKLLAEARAQFAGALQADLAPLAKRLQQIYQWADDERLSDIEFATVLEAFRQNELPKLLIEINADPETGRVLEQVLAAAMSNGIAGGAEVVKEAVS